MTSLRNLVPAQADRQDPGIPSAFIHPSIIHQRCTGHHWAPGGLVCLENAALNTSHHTLTCTELVTPWEELAAHRVEANRQELRGQRAQRSERAGPGRHPSAHLLLPSLPHRGGQGAGAR